MKAPFFKSPALYFLKAIAVSNFKRIKHPFKCSLAITYKCNMRCKTCNIWKKSSDKSELTVQEIGSFFKKAGNFSWVGLTGGEPFLRDDITDIADEVVKYSNRLYGLHFPTNGYLTNRILEAVRKIRSKHKKLRLLFSVSMDGPPHVHNKIRGIDNAWERAIDTFCQLKQIPNAKAVLGYTISQHNTGKFREAFEASKKRHPELKLDDLSINIMQKSSFYYDNVEMESVDELEVLKEINDIIKMDKDRPSVNNFLRKNYLKLYKKYYDLKKSPIKCQAMSSTLFIDSYGDLFPCGVFNKKLINIRDIAESLISLWNSNEARKVAFECSNGMCPSCWSPCDAHNAIAGSLVKVIAGKI
jgi:radical SAM protein with 4Fe4S-binding SPASM domain